ncbi:shikimate dehydrogenase [Roseomonas sp. SSH11]|uniref:Shikimate dehydrogenase (NADP(+)) n=1 Tax=Pararoseomonas baculiformis TaxID=2820812 RepID=A0ABS4AAX9_9PROT|nr:shikimate dehydrogenase [Pararoseomonas baculiformis]MBP0444164.1 shikimate dehydrogenase [Pararoseomonas baculiformis]
MAASNRVLLGLLGYPIAHSAAPAMMEAAGSAVGLDIRLHLIEVADAPPERLRRILDGIRLIGFAGINVTFPYKQSVIPFLDAMDPGASQIGAVNLVTVRDGGLTGHNTDATGFLSGLRETIGEAVTSGPAVLVGAGGAGRAIAWALAQAGVPEVRVLDQDRSRAESLARDASGWGGGRFVAAPDAASAMAGAQGLLNASPAGMLPDCSSPVDTGLLRKGMWVADAVYHPPLTPLLAAAQAKGCALMPGRAMSVAQAEDGFRLFTGREAPPGVIAAAFDRHIGGQ